MKLSNVDLERWTQALAQLPSEAEEFLPWVESHVKTFFPFSQVFLAHGELVAGEISVTHSMSSGHDHAYLQQLSTTFELGVRTSLAWWLQHRQPFFIDPVNPAAHVGAFELAEMKQFGLRNVAAHGVVNLRATAGSYFSFSDVQTPLSDWHLDALRLIAPVLNDLFLALIADGVAEVGRGTPVPLLTEHRTFRLAKSVNKPLTGGLLASNLNYTIWFNRFGKLSKGKF